MSDNHTHGNRHPSYDTLIQEHPNVNLFRHRGTHEQRRRQQEFGVQSANHMRQVHTTKRTKKQILKIIAEGEKSVICRNKTEEILRTKKAFLLLLPRLSSASREDLLI